MVCALALIFSLGFAETATMAAGEEPTVDFNSPDAIKSTLEQQVWKRVKVKLESGQDLEAVKLLLPQRSWGILGHNLRALQVAMMFGKEPEGT